MNYQFGVCNDLVGIMTITSIFVGMVVMGVVEGQQVFEYEGFAQVDEVCKNFEKFGGECRVDEVVGGVGASPCRFPYLVSIQLPTDKNSTYRHFCAGTLISPKFVLTAAHCFSQLVAKQPHSSGLYNVQDLDGIDVFAARNPFCRHMTGGGRVGIWKVFVHVDFEGLATKGSDIAIVQLEQQFEGYEGPFMNFQFPESMSITHGQSSTYLYTIAGWGSINYQDTKDYRFAQTVSQLQMGFVDFVNYTECNEKTSIYQIQVEEDTMICFGSSDVDSCQGDSGGPLIAIDVTAPTAQTLIQAGFPGQAVQYSQPTNDIQIGITSWGPDDKCGGRDVIQPGVYTNMRNFQHWIQQAMSVITQEYNSNKNQLPEMEAGSEVTHVIDTAISENSDKKRSAILKTADDIDGQSIFYQNGQNVSGSWYNQGIDSIGEIIIASQQYLPEECSYGADSGPCENYESRYYYDKQEKICKSFQYGGCNGNKNNFLLLKECQDTCADS